MFAMGIDVRPRLRLTVVAVLVLLSWSMPLRAQTSPVLITVNETTFTYTEDSDVTVEVVLQNALGITGVDFVLAYPTDRFGAFVQTLDGDLGLTYSTNPDFGSPPADFAWIKFSGARATGSTVDSGVLIRFVLRAPCAGNAQLFPTGRPATLSFADPQQYLAAFDDNVLPMAIESVDANITLNCTAVSTEEEPSFGALKAFYGSRQGVR